MRLQRLRAGQARLLSGGGARPSGQHGAARVAALAPLKTTLAVDKTHRPSGQHGAARVAALAPLKTTLAVDKTHHWCSCGHAGLASGKATALCDGSHKHVLGGKFSPLKFKVELVHAEQPGAAHGAAHCAETTTTTVDRFLCMCKQSATAPYCDGSHAKMAKA
jgi:CDGSH-type Zn-finger protein